MKTTKHIKRRLRKVILSAALLAMAVVFLFPLILIVTNSFMSEQEIENSYSMVTSSNPDRQESILSGKYANVKLIPDIVTLSQYYTALIKRTQFLIKFWNSLIAERKIAELTKEMNMSTVTAPCDGVVTELYYSAGMTANASQPLYRIADTGGGFQFVVTVNISAAEYLEPGDEAKISINALNDEVIQGKVNKVKDNQQQIGVKKDVIIDIPPDGLIGGEVGTADIKKNIGSYKTLVSNSAVGQDNKGYFVYVLKERSPWKRVLCGKGVYQHR